MPRRAHRKPEEGNLRQNSGNTTINYRMCLIFDTVLPWFPQTRLFQCVSLKCFSILLRWVGLNFDGGQKGQLNDK